MRKEAILHCLCLCMIWILTLGVMPAQATSAVQGPSLPLRILAEESPPFSYTTADGRISGLMVDIVREIQGRVGDQSEIRIVPWARGLLLLESRDPVLLFAMGRTAVREPLYQWIGPIYQNSYSLYSLSDAGFQLHSLEDARQATAIGVYRGDIRDQILSGLGFENLSRLEDPGSLVRLLLAGQVPLIASSPLAIDAILARAGQPPDRVRLQLSFGQAKLYIAASLATPADLVGQWNQALAEMRADGSLLQLFIVHNMMVGYPEADSLSP